MTDDSNTQDNQPASDTKELGELSFADYQAVRRGEKVESKSAPVAKTELKKAANSEFAETENEEANESDDDALSGEDTDDSEDSERDKPKKKGGFKRRIDKLNSRVAERERELEYWKSQALKDKGATEQAKAAVETVSNVDGKPSPDNFETHADYVEALTDWKIEKREALAKANEEKSKLANAQEKLMDAHLARVKSFAEKNDDFQEVLESVDHVPMSPAIQELILSSDNGPELMYELAKNPKEYARICALSPLATARAIGQIETQIASRSSEDKKIETKKLTAAPKPIAPVGGSKGSVSKSISDPEISFADYEKLRRAQLKRK